VIASDQRKSLISLEQAGLTYRRRTGFLRTSRFEALTEVSLELREGESLGIVGRNGSGKSTLMKILAGILQPSRGRLINHGCSVALLTLQLGFDPNLSGRQNILMSGMLLGFRLKYVRSFMEPIIDFSGLGAAIDNPLHTYSTGMKARLGFSVAFHLDPDVLLVDEVFGVGDANFKQKSQKVMEEKVQSDKTIVMVSHSLPLLQRLCDRILWIESGKAYRSGDPDEVLPAYREHLQRANGGS